MEVNSLNQGKLATSRTGSNGMAGTAIAVPVFEGGKWCRLDSNLRMHYRMAYPSGSPYLGTSKRSSSDFFKSSSIQSIDDRIEASQFSMAILERETSVQIGEGLTWAPCLAVISGSSVQSLL